MRIVDNNTKTVIYQTSQTISCFSNLLKVVDGRISAGQSCSPEHLQQRHGLLQDLPQRLGVGQQTLHTAVVQDLNRELS